MPGLGTSFGRGGATDYQQDLMNSDCIVIMGSNMAENHPVGFQWVMEARERGAKVFHVDPRFTRTSAMATKHVGIRAGSDIAFLGGIVNYIFEHERWFDEYVKNYTNAVAIIDPEFRDTDDLDGLFSGWDPETKQYDTQSWKYDGMTIKAGKPPKGEQAGHGGGSSMLRGGEPPKEDPTLQDPHCVFQIVKRHFARYTPEAVADACGCTVDEFLEVAEALCANSGREHTAAFVYAVGWTQHTVGVQVIRTAAIIQLLLGNMGRPGGGIVALRGHASIQGSTDIPTLYNTLPGYIDMPHVEDEEQLDKWLEFHRAEGGWWNKLDAYLVSLLKAWWGAAATPENEFCFSYLPRIDDDNSNYWTVQQMLEGKVEGYILVGQNPAVGSANGRAQRLAMANLDWLVVRDIVEIESAAFWYDSPEIESGELTTEQIPTEVFFLPAATHVEKDGSFTNTQRLLQWHYKAVEPKEDCRSDLWFYYHLGKKIRERLKSSQDPRDLPVQDLTWAYPTTGEQEDPSAEAVLSEINGWNDKGEALAAYKLLKDDGTTASGCWIYCGVFSEDQNMAARKKPHWEQSYAAHEWGWAWPANRRLLYNRASADPDGNPWSERKKLVWWDPKQKKWTGNDTPDFDEEKPPDYRPDGRRDRPGGDRRQPPVHHARRRPWLALRSAGARGRPAADALRAARVAVPEPALRAAREPRAGRSRSTRTRTTRPASEEFPYVVTTYRLTEHHTAGGMSRTIPYLSELQPQMFVEVHPALARERGLEHGGWATIVTARSAIEARVMVTERMRPVRVAGRLATRSACPTTGGSAA